MILMTSVILILIICILLFIISVLFFIVDLQDELLSLKQKNTQRLKELELFKYRNQVPGLILRVSFLILNIFFLYRISITGISTRLHYISCYSILFVLLAVS